MNILVAMDFSDVHDRLLETASRLGRALKGELWLVHVAMPEPAFVGYDAGPPTVRDNLAERMRDEHRQVQGAADELIARGVDAKGLLLAGPTADTLLHKAKELDVGLIVMGSHGRGAMHHLLLGSVSEAVLRKATCPVVLVPPRREG